FFGEFDFSGTVSLREVAGFYGLTPDAETAELTLAALFAARFDNAPEVGDHLPIGATTLVVREIIDGRVTRVGLQVATTLEERTGTAVNSGIRLLKRLAARLLP